MAIQIDRVRPLLNQCLSITKSVLSSCISSVSVRSDDQILLLVCKWYDWIIILKLFLIIGFLIWEKILAGGK